MIRSVITGTGCYIPELRVCNEAFTHARFFEQNGVASVKSNESVIEKFKEITGIYERRYAKDDQQTSDLAFFSGKAALEDSGIDKETLDYIIVTHNFGDVINGRKGVDIVPSLASRVKTMLGINNPDCVAFDLSFGCPGWIEGLIQANYFIRSGDARRCLIIGAEVLSRVIDPHDRDSMIYSDGSGAVVLEAASNTDKGILSHKTRTFAGDHAMLLRMGQSYSRSVSCKEDLYLKMKGHKVYEFALNNVPLLIKDVLDKAAIPIDAISKILIHQANDKMDHAILERTFKLLGRSSVPPGVMPMTIGWLGNSSVATVPTLLDLIMQGKLAGHEIKEEDVIVFASVGAGMNMNAMVYKF
jgi:3-oxoacyl-[acyl-carrier-protein] synthase-3